MGEKWEINFTRPHRITFPDDGKVVYVVPGTVPRELHLPDQGRRFEAGECSLVGVRALDNAPPGGKGVWYTSETGEPGAFLDLIQGNASADFPEDPEYPYLRAEVLAGDPARAVPQPGPRRLRQGAERTSPRTADGGHRTVAVTPIVTFPQEEGSSPWALWWGGWDSNPRPTDYESAALTG